MEYIKITPTIHLLIDPADRKKSFLGFIYSSGGSLSEKPEDRGRKHLMEHCIASRTKDMDFQQFKDYTFKENISTNAYTSPVLLGVEAMAHYKDFKKVFDLLFGIFTEPAFDQEGLDREKEIVLREISDRSGDPNYRKYYDIAKQIFSEDSYNAHEVLGSSEQVAKTTLADFERLHQENLAKSHLVFCISGGGIDVEYMKNKVGEFLEKSDYKEVSLIKNQEEKDSISLDLRNNFLDFEKVGLQHELAHEHAELAIYIPCPVTFDSKPVREIFSGLFLRYNCGGLYDRLRDELGLIYGYYFSYDKYSQTLAIELNCELKDVKTIVGEVNQFFDDFEKRFKQNKFTEFKDLIKKKQDIAKDDLGADSRLVVKNLTEYGEYEDYSGYTKRIEVISTDDLKDFFESIQEGLKKQKAVVISNKKEVKNIF